MSLTVKEKEHWKERIGRRIDAAIEQLKLSDDVSDELKRIDAEAVKHAESSLGLAELTKRFRELSESKQRLIEQLESVSLQMDQKLGTSSGYSSYSDSTLPYLVQNKIDRRAKIHRLVLLKASELGCKVLKLEREKEDLLDTVWLSISTKQIKQLWSDVAEMLNVEQTELQKQAIAMDPVDPEAK